MQFDACLAETEVAGGTLEGSDGVQWRDWHGFFIN